jgi:hypothetical protein
MLLEIVEQPEVDRGPAAPRSPARRRIRRYIRSLPRSGSPFSSSRAAARSERFSKTAGQRSRRLSCGGYADATPPTAPLRAATTRECCEPPSSGFRVLQRNARAVLRHRAVRRSEHRTRSSEVAHGPEVVYDELARIIGSADEYAQAAADLLLRLPVPTLPKQFSASPWVRDTNERGPLATLSCSVAATIAGRAAFRSISMRLRVDATAEELGPLIYPRFVNAVAEIRANLLIVV